MSFIYGTNVELLFSMPAVGATIAASGAKVVSGTSATCPAFQLPPLQSIWSPANMVGKSMRAMASGGTDNTAMTNTMSLQFDGTAGTTGITACATGAATWAAQTIGFWQLEVNFSCVSVGINTSSWYASGFLTTGAGSAPTTFASSISFANPIAAGLPQSFALATNVGYYPEIWCNWVAGPVAFICSQYHFWALN